MASKHEKEMAERIEAKMAMEAQGDANYCTSDAIPLIDQLKAKRARIASDSARRCKALDRQINLLLNSDAEAIVRSATVSLFED